MKKSLLFFFLIILSNKKIYSQKNEILDSINKYYWLIKDNDIGVKNRLQYALKAKKYSDKYGVDSIKLRVQRQLSLMYFSNEMFEPYIQLNKENLELATLLYDSTAIKVASTNLGSYYLYTEQNDSSYYYYSKALDYFKTNDISIDKAQSLLALADIQQEEKAYSGAEEDAISAIKILNQLPKTEYTLQLYWSLYNILGFISENTLDKEKTLEYHDKSISYSAEMDDGFLYKISSINNKANVYRKFGEYTKALKLYESLLDLKNKYEDDELDFYPTLLINISKTKLESGDYEYDEIESYLKEAYKLCYDIDYLNGLMAACLELSRLYLDNNKTGLARKYGNEALKISNDVSNNEYKMDALLTLSYLYDGEKGKELLRQHISLSDSLQTVARLVKNKFARVKFDTDQIEAENKKISQKNLILIGSLLTLLGVGILVYIILLQRAKNKELRLVQMQQKANEDIYNLLLEQQDKVEEARSQEKTRVSQELHDGVLGRLFGTRLSLDSLNFSDGKDAMLSRANYISQLKTIEEDIRKISHDMNTDFVSGSGFIDIVSELIENQAKAYGLKYDFNYTDDFSWELVDNKTKINIYRIIQESLQNIYKHAEAKHVKISIYRQKNVFCLDIEDNGKGFDSSKSKKGIGLKNMISRIDDIGGKIDFISQLNKGTTVSLKIPYNI